MQKQGRITRKRLRLKKKKGAVATIDRWINFVVGTVDSEVLASLRGSVFYVDTEREALERFWDLKKLAREAREEGREKEFLEALDGKEEVAGSGGGEQFFRDFIDEWAETCLSKGDETESSLESDLSIIENHLKPFFGPDRLDQIDVRRIDQFIAQQRRKEHQFGVGYAPSTINNQLSVLHRCLQRAISYKYIADNPVLSEHWQSRDRTPEDNENWLEPDEEDQLFLYLLDKWTGNPTTRLALLTHLFLGIRIGELRALRGSDLRDSPQKGVMVRRSIARTQVYPPKNKKARFHALPPDLWRELKEHVGADPNAPLFRPPRGELLAKTSYNRWLRKACHEAGVREVTSHGLRHTAGSSYSAMGYSQRAIASLLGHTDTKSTEGYVHTADSMKTRAAMERWSNLTKMRSEDGQGGNE